MVTNNELDLDKLEALARKADDGEDGWRYYTAFQEALLPSTVLQLIELARRSTSGSDDSAYQRGYLDGIAKGRRDASEDRAEASGSDGTAAVGAVTLPDWHDAMRAVEQIGGAGAATPLDIFIYNNEPAGDSDETHFRAQLQAVIDYVAGGRATTSGSELAGEREMFIAYQRKVDNIPDVIDDETIMKGGITNYEWAGWQARAALAQQVGACAKVDEE